MAKRTNEPFAPTLAVIHGALLAGVLTSTAAAETSTAVFMPGSLSDATIAQQLYDGLQESLTHPEAGSTFLLVDLAEQSTVMRKEWPEEVFPDHRGFQRQHIAPAVDALAGHFNKVFSNGGAPLAHTTVPDDTGWPYRLNALPQYAGQVERMVIVTPIRSQDNRAPEMDTHQLVPSQAMLDLGTMNPFGAEGLEATLTGTEIWVCVLDRDWPHPAQAAYLRDFYALKIERMGGKLMAWTENLPECIEMARAGKAMRLPKIERNPEQEIPAFLDVSQESWEIARVLEGYDLPETPMQAADPTVDLSWGANLAGRENLSDADFDKLSGLVESGTLSPVTATFADYDQVDHDKLRIHIPLTRQSVDITLTGDPQSITFLINESGAAKLTGLDEGQGGGVTAKVTMQDGSERKLQIGAGETRDIAFRR
ncbi:hypothetical protein [Tritonibacter scottomollicae]|uniref:hypothetical protein n=1 Tax=Tritonibacter scottomollicae TaxID=483013 RepID=UPI003AA7E0B8